MCTVHDKFKRGFELTYISFAVGDDELPKAIAAARFDHSGKARTVCEKGTRETILDKLRRWLKSDSSDTDSCNDFNKDFCLLHGLAGSGKSTIAQTTATECDEEEILGGTFMCSRDSEECSNVKNIIPTVVCQLCRFDDTFRRRVSEIYVSDRAVQDADPEAQVRKLLVGPLRAISNMKHFVVIIDALDECTDAAALLEALDRYKDELGPLKFFFTGRPIIEDIILPLDLYTDVYNIDLNKIAPKEAKIDIDTYLRTQLSRIARTRRFVSWPSDKDLKYLVELANGLFIFAATTVKFLSRKGTFSPKEQLATLLGSKSPISDSPYKYLDILYLQVFTTAFDEIADDLKDRIQTVFGTLVLIKETFSLANLGIFLGSSTNDIRDTLYNLHSLVVVPEDDEEDIRLIHPSIHDFLTDASRCTDDRFYVKKAAGHSHVTRYCFQAITKFAKSTEVRSVLEKPTRRELDSLEKNLYGEGHSAVSYSYTYWNDHISQSVLGDEMMAELESFIANHDKSLLLMSRYPGEAAFRLLHIIDLMDLSVRMLRE